MLKEQEDEEEWYEAPWVCDACGARFMLTPPDEGENGVIMDGRRAGFGTGDPRFCPWCGAKKDEFVTVPVPQTEGELAEVKLG